MRVIFHALPLADAQWDVRNILERDKCLVVLHVLQHKKLECTSSKDSGLRGVGFKRDFQLIRFMVMQPCVGCIADVARPAFSA